MTPLRPKFWETIPLTKMTPAEWEAVCDGRGESCRCAKYEVRHQFVPDCVRLTPKTLPKVAYWLPKTCGYKLLQEGKPLHDWHPLISGDPSTTHTSGNSVQGWTIPEFEVPEDDWDQYTIEEEL